MNSNTSTKSEYAAGNLNSNNMNKGSAMESNKGSSSESRSGSQSGSHGFVESRGALSEQAHTLKKDLNAVGQDAAEMAKTAAHCVQDEADRLLKQGGEKVQEITRSARQQVTSHPGTAVLISLGVGLVLGRLLAGR